MEMQEQLKQAIKDKMDLEMEFVSLKKNYMLLKEENNGIIVIRS